MKLLRNQKVVEGLQEMIDSFTSKEALQSEMHAVNDLDRQRNRMGKEMRLTS